MTQNQYHRPLDIYYQEDLNKIIKGGVVYESVIVRGPGVKSLDKVYEIQGSLGLSDSTIKNLGSLQKIHGDFWIGQYYEKSKISSLACLKYVGGNLKLSGSQIKNLGDLTFVEGKLNLRDTSILNLGSLQKVGGDLFLPKHLEKNINLDNIEVQGKIKFFNTVIPETKPTYEKETKLIKLEGNIPIFIYPYIYSFNDFQTLSNTQKQFYKFYKKSYLNKKYIDIEGNNNYAYLLTYDLLENYDKDFLILKRELECLEKYYPVANRGKQLLIEKFQHDQELAWKLSYPDKCGGYTGIIDFEIKLGRELFDAELLIQLVGYKFLTAFGQNNIEEIKKHVVEELNQFKIDMNTSSFFQLFLKNGLPIKKDSKYFEKFFSSIDEYKTWKELDEHQLKCGYKRSIPHIIEKAIFSQCRTILKKSEDRYRVKIGMPKVGEGWISETELFYKISSYFNNMEVTQHASPEWLGRQHLDIYIAEINVGIEYQGAQHFRPIEFFGGEESFKKTLERDKRKKRLCRENDCLLIYAKEGYLIDDIISQIKNKVKQKK